MLKRLVVISIMIASGTCFASIDETWGSGVNTLGTTFNSGAELKGLKKIGVGTTAAGAMGLLGLNLFINFSPDFTLSLGYGFSRGFNSANINFRYAMGGDQLIPYFTGGYSRWFSTQDDEPVGKTSPSFFKNRFLNSKERATGQFGENLLYPGIGLEFLNKGGEWSGLSFFAEVIYLLDIDDFEAAPTAGIGTVLYF